MCTYTLIQILASTHMKWFYQLFGKIPRMNIIMDNGYPHHQFSLPNILNESVSLVLVVVIIITDHKRDTNISFMIWEVMHFGQIYKTNMHCLLEQLVHVSLMTCEKDHNLGLLWWWLWWRLWLAQAQVWEARDTPRRLGGSEAH